MQLLDHDDGKDVNTISNRCKFDIKDINYRESELKSTDYLYRCYNNNCNFHTNDKGEYEIHGHTKHEGKPCYPSKADLELYRWKAQGKEWEKAVDRKDDIAKFIARGNQNNMKSEHQEGVR
jgi:hypothetical protein